MWWDESKDRTARARLAEPSSEMHIHRVAVAMNVPLCPFLTLQRRCRTSSDKGRTTQHSLPYLSAEGQGYFKSVFRGRLPEAD